MKLQKQEVVSSLMGEIQDDKRVYHNFYMVKKSITLKGGHSYENKIAELETTNEITKSNIKRCRKEHRNIHTYN
jgi:hypothetical protein